MLKGSAGLLASSLLYGGGGLSEFRASNSVEVILPTFAGRCGWTRCLLHTARFEKLQGAVAHLLSIQGDDGGSLGGAGLGFLVSN